MAQADPNADTSGLEARYPKAKLGDFDGDPQRSPRWMRSSPISRCSARWSISRPMTTPPATAEETDHGLQHDAPLRRQLGPARHGAVLRRRGRSSSSAPAARRAADEAARIPLEGGLIMSEQAYRRDHRRRDHRPRVGRHQGAQQPAAALVAVDLLRHHRLGARLYDRLSGLAAVNRDQGRARLFQPRRGRAS